MTTFRRFLALTQAFCAGINIVLIIDEYNVALNVILLVINSVGAYTNSEPTE